MHVVIPNYMLHRSVTWLSRIRGADAGPASLMIFNLLIFRFLDSLCAR